MLMFSADSGHASHRGASISGAAGARGVRPLSGPTSSRARSRYAPRRCASTRCSSGRCAQPLCQCTDAITAPGVRVASVMHGQGRRLRELRGAPDGDSSNSWSRTRVRASRRGPRRIFEPSLDQGDRQGHGMGSRWCTARARARRTRAGREPARRGPASGAVACRAAATPTAAMPSPGASGDARGLRPH